MIDQFIGGTPTIRLERVVEPDMAEVWVKLEGMNPGGSIKDRPALAMIQDAEAKGLLKAGSTIVEPTSGNTGVGLAQVAASRGYHLILCMPEQMSLERRRTLEAYGAEIVLTDPELRMIAAIAEAERIRDETGAFLPNQFDNPANPRAHYETTAPVMLAWEETAFPLARRLTKEEGLFVGMSSGAIVEAALQVAREIGPGHRVVCIAPDSGSRYLTTSLYEAADAKV
jgi:cysteine synthase A